MDTLDRLSTGFKAWLLLFLITFAAAAPGVFTLPALDRDESRFAQASKQMLETGDFIAIRYQDEFRNKKPAGIHWLQAGSTALFSDTEAMEIWSYRVPSWIGASLATLAAFWAGLVLVGRRAAFLGAALFGATLLLTSEAHISKTDGVLIFFTTLGLGALARLYIRADHDRRMATLFWAAMGLGFLIKGPVTPMVAAYAGFGVWLWDRLRTGQGGDWWRGLLWWPGPALFVLLVLPWLIWIQLATGGTYIEGAVGKDLRDKLVTASEGHGGPPGYHLAHIPALFFPATLFLLPAIAAVIAAFRRQKLDLVGGSGLPGLRFLLAWAIPTWVFFEFLPTKLSHYILPAYPAFALLVGYGALRLMEGARRPWLKSGSMALFALGGAAMLAVSWPAVDRLLLTDAASSFTTVAPALVAATWENMVDYPLGFWWAGAVLVFAALTTMALGRNGAAAGLAIASAIAIGWHVRIAFLPAQTWVQPTEQARAALADACAMPAPIPAPEGCPASPAAIQAVGYTEPSFVMTLGTQNRHPPETVVELPEAESDLPTGFLINLEDPSGPPARDALLAAAEARGLCVTRSRPTYALNYSNGDPVHFVALRFDAPPCAGAPQISQVQVPR